MDVDDIKYLWPAYREGETPLEEGLTPVEFQSLMSDHLAETYDEAYVVEAPTKSGKIPVGIIFGKYMGPFLSPIGTTWFSWASKRNIVESLVAFVNEIRKDNLLVGFYKNEEKSILEYMARHGIIRRVGKVSGVYEGEEALMFQSRGEK